MNKKSLIILGSILGLIVIIAVVIFYVSSKQAAPSADLTVQGNNQNTTGNNGTTSNVGGSPTPTAIPTPTPADITSITGLSKLTDTEVTSPALSYDGKAVWYFTSDGRLYKINASNGIKQEYVLPKSLTVENVIWPMTGNDFIVDSGAASSPRFHYYDSDSHTYIDYSANIKSVDFMPDGRHVAYVWVSGDKASLSTANFDTSSHQTIANLPDAGDVVKVSPDGKKAFAFNSTKPDDGKLLYIPFDTKKVITISTADDNSTLWSPDGQTFVFYRKDPTLGGSQLWLSDINDKNSSKPTNLNTSLSRVAFNSDGSKLYVAVPLDSSKDSVWSVDTKTYEKKQVFANEKFAPIQIKNLLISPDNKTLFFVNSDGFLYSLSIQ